MMNDGLLGVRHWSFALAWSNQRSFAADERGVIRLLGESLARFLGAAFLVNANVPAMAPLPRRPTGSASRTRPPAGDANHVLAVSRLWDVVQVFGKQSLNWHLEEACRFRMNDDRAV